VDYRPDRVLLLLAGIVYNLNATRIYRAQSSIIIQIRGSDDVIRPGTVMSTPQIGNLWAFKTRIETINSEPMMQRLVERLVERGYFKAELERIGYDKLSEENQRAWRNLTALGFKGRITVQNPKDTNVAKISFLSPDPVMARDIVNFLAEIVSEASRDQQKKEMEESLSSINEKKAEAKKKLELAEGKLYAYRQENKIFNLEMDQKLIANQREALVARLADISDLRRDAEAKIQQLDLILARKDYTRFTPVSTDNLVLNSLNEQLVSSQVDYEDLLVRYDEKHPT